MQIARKIWSLLSAEQRRAAGVLVVLMLFGMILETMGIGLIIPVLALMTKSEQAGRQIAIEPLVKLLGSPTHAQLLVITMLALVGIYFVKALYLAFLAWRQSRFVFALQVSLSRRLFDAYLHQPYTFHLQRNSAQLMRNVLRETSEFSFVAMIPGATIVAEGLVLIGIGCLLLVIEPIGAMVVLIIVGSAGYAFYKMTRMRVLRWGEARQHHEGMRTQHLQQGLGGVKEVKLLGREEQFLEQYATHDACVARVLERQLVMQALPRLWLELLAVIGLAGLVLVMLWLGRAEDTFIPTLGLFAAAAFRLMPSVSKVLASTQSLRFALPVVNTLQAELSLPNNVSQQQCEAGPVPFHRALRLDNVSYAYPDTSQNALSSVTFSIPCGAAVGFVGSSGAGKSTLIDVILGLLTPTQGAVLVDDGDIQLNVRGWQRQVGYVPQSIYLTDDSLRCNIAFGLPSEQIDDAAVWYAIRAAQLDTFVKELPKGLDTFVGERGVRISGGQRQRIGIARALYHDPAVLVLDEATSALDSVTEQGVVDAVRALRGTKTVLIIAHRSSAVEHCDMIVTLARGTVVEIHEKNAGCAKTLPSLDAGLDLVGAQKRRAG
jgi:ATP-binding cassette, subfamily B, bacterial PglK